MYPNISTGTYIALHKGSSESFEILRTFLIEDLESRQEWVLSLTF